MNKETKLYYLKLLLEEAAGRRNEGMIDNFLREVENDLGPERIQELRNQAHEIVGIRVDIRNDMGKRLSEYRAGK